MATKNPDQQTFSVSTKSVFRGLLYVIAFLLGLHLLLQFLFHVHGIEVLSTLRGRFDVDNEISIPTWFSQILLLVPALLSLVIYKVSRRQKDGNSVYWLLLGSLFVFLSADEGAMLHEAFITKFRETTTAGASSGIAQHTWLIPVGVALVLLLIPFLKFVRRLPKKTAVILAVGLAMYVFGAIVYETIGLVNVANVGFAYQGLSVAFEEALEMFGATIVIWALLDYLSHHAPKFSITLRP